MFRSEPRVKKLRVSQQKGYVLFRDVPWMGPIHVFNYKRSVKSRINIFPLTRRIQYINNGVGDAYIMPTIKAFFVVENNLRLILNFRANEITDAGATACVKYLRDISLDTVHLEHNHLTDEVKQQLLKTWVGFGKKEADGLALEGLYL